jgi:hypothetical protein
LPGSRLDSSYRELPGACQPFVWFDRSHYACDSSGSERSRIEATTMGVMEPATFLEVSRDTVHRLIKARQLTAHKKTLAPRSAYQVDAASVIAYDKRRRAPAL